MLKTIIVICNTMLTIDTIENSSTDDVTAVSV